MGYDVRSNDHHARSGVVVHRAIDKGDLECYGQEFRL
jgi:hypothetical protein